MIDYDKLWEEVSDVVSKNYAAPIQPHEKTERELQIAWTLSKEQTKNAIRLLIGEGKLGSRMGKSKNGREVLVFFPVEK